MCQNNLPYHRVIFSPKPSHDNDTFWHTITPLHTDKGTTRQEDKVWDNTDQTIIHNSYDNVSTIEAIEEYIEQYIEKKCFRARHADELDGFGVTVGSNGSGEGEFVSVSNGSCGDDDRGGCIDVGGSSGHKSTSCEKTIRKPQEVKSRMIVCVPFLNNR